MIQYQEYCRREDGSGYRVEHCTLKKSQNCTDIIVRVKSTPTLKKIAVQEFRGKTSAERWAMMLRIKKFKHNKMFHI